MLWAWSHPLTPLWAGFCLFMVALLFFAIQGLTGLNTRKVFVFFRALAILLWLVAVAEIVAGQRIL
jgi:hypothetical protein